MFTALLGNMAGTKIDSPHFTLPAVIRRRAIFHFYGKDVA